MKENPSAKTIKPDLQDKDANKKQTYLGQGDIYDYYNNYFKKIKLRFPDFLAGPAFAYDADAALSGTYTDPSNKKTKDAIKNEEVTVTK